MSNFSLDNGGYSIYVDRIFVNDSLVNVTYQNFASLKSVSVDPESPFDISHNEYQELYQSAQYLKSNLSEALYAPLVSLSLINTTQTAQLASEANLEFNENMTFNQQIIDGINQVALSIGGSNKETVRRITSPGSTDLLDDLKSFLGNLGITEDFVIFIGFI